MTHNNHLDDEDLMLGNMQVYGSYTQEASATTGYFNWGPSDAPNDPYDTPGVAQHVENGHMQNRADQHEAITQQLQGVEQLYTNVEATDDLMLQPPQKRMRKLDPTTDFNISEKQPGMPPGDQLHRDGFQEKEKLSQGLFISEVKQIEVRLQHVRASLVQSDFASVVGELQACKQQLMQILQSVETLETKQFLEPKEFKASEQLTEYIKAHLLPQIQIYEGDVEYLQQGVAGQRGDPVYLGLFQEKAGVVLHKKFIGTFSLRLLTSSRASHVSTGHVQPTLLNIAQRNKQKNQELETYKKVFDQNGVAVFNDLKFPSGTFPSLVSIAFTVQIQVVVDGTTLTKLLESAPSKPFISMTNTNSQWKKAAGYWLKQDAFGDQFEITIPYFWNHFQKHYLVATKQDINDIQRPLFLTDFDYLLKAKFNQGIEEKTVITQKEFDQFWNWLGPGLKKIRYQQHLLWLFNNGYLCTFVTGREAERALKDEQVGTFLIRLSKRMEGEFVISYKIKPEETRHYLIQPDDTADKKKTLIDFLGENKSFVYILQLRTTPDGKKMYVKHDKDQVLGRYYRKATKRAQQGAKSTNPYDQRVFRLQPQHSPVEGEQSSTIDLKRKRV